MSPSFHLQAGHAVCRLARATRLAAGAPALLFGVSALPVGASAQSPDGSAPASVVQPGATAASAPAPAVADPSEPLLGSGQTLPDVRATAKAESLGKTVLGVRALAGTPGGNGDFTSLLRVLPGVQFDNAQLSSETLGEIQPANVSINGAKFYDNLFLIDGMSINNRIDPGNSNPAALTAPSLGNSQGLALDTSLLCRLEVLDSNVEAEYGGFSGGVIQAETCTPERAFGGEVSVEHTSSDWTQYKIHPAEKTRFEQSASASAQPSFDKWFYRAMLEGRPADDIGLRLSLVKKKSEIPLAGYTNGLHSVGDASRKTQTRDDDLIDLRGWWTPAPGVKARFGLAHDPGAGRYFIANARDSYYEVLSGGTALSAELKHLAGEHLTLTHEFETARLRTSRDADRSVWKLWRYSADKNWGNPAGNSGEGGYGDVDQTQHTSAYRLKAEARPLQWGAIRHAIAGGLAAEHTRFHFERLEQYEQYTASTATTTCALATGGVDTDFCSTATPYNATSGGQYLRSRILHKAGRYDLDDTRLALFLQDEMSLGRIRLRAGLRWENDRLARDPVLAPRLAGAWDMAGDGRSVLEAGANRYYGSNVFQYYSNAKRLALQSSPQTRGLVNGQIGAWADPVYGSTAAMYHVGDLKQPYADERVIALRQFTGPIAWTMKYVDRRGKDEVVLHLRSAGNYWWDNVGSSRSKTWTLKATTAHPLVWSGTRTTFMFAADSTDVESSHANYSDTMSSLAGDLERVIRWDGRYVRWSDRPADNYNRPWTLKLATSTEIPSWRLSVDALASVRASYEKMAATDEQVEYEGSMVDVYEKQRFGTSTTVDLRAQWALPTVKGQEAYVSVTIENLFNKTNTIESNDTSASYEKGRQAWLRLGYRF